MTLSRRGLMYTMIVVDDEAIIRHGIVNSMPWEAWGFSVVGQAKDGYEALELVKQHHPNVIFSDIRMPNMDGIQLMNIVSEKYSDTEIVIISGYSDIEYYRHAITCQVTEYLEKPTCLEDFEKVAKILKDKLDQRYAKEKERRELKKRLMESLPQMREIFLQKLLKGYYKDSNLIKEKMSFYSVPLTGANMAIATVSMDNYSGTGENYEEQRHLLNVSIVYEANKLLKSEELQGFFFINDSMVTGILASDDPEILSQTVALMEKLQESIKMYDITVSGGISQPSQNLVDLSLLYHQAKEALKQRIYLGDESITCFNDINTSNNDLSYILCRFDIEKIINVVFYEGDEELEALIDQVFVHFINRVTPRYDYIDKLWYELHFAIARYAIAFDFNIEKALSLHSDLVGVDISAIENLGRKREYILSVLKETKQQVRKKRQDNNSILISKIKNHVDATYYENALCLNAIAEKFDKSPAYISKLFKKELGQNFTDYVLGLRMNLAKELLEDITLKTYEIANRVGYADPSHFIKLFKKHTGMSTSKYREKYKKV